MDTKENLQENTFKSYYNSLDNEHKGIIRDKFLKESGLSYPGFYSKLKYGKFTPLELKELSRLCGREFKRQDKYHSKE